MTLWGMYFIIWSEVNFKMILPNTANREREGGRKEWIWGINKKKGGKSADNDGTL